MTTSSLCELQPLPDAQNKLRDVSTQGDMAQQLTDSSSEAAT